MKDSPSLKQDNVYSEAQTDVKEAITCKASQKAGSVLQGLHFIRILRNKIPKENLFHEKVILNAIPYSAFLKFLKAEIFQLLLVNKKSIKS